MSSDVPCPWNELSRIDLHEPLAYYASFIRFINLFSLSYVESLIYALYTYEVWKKIGFRLFFRVSFSQKPFEGTFLV